MSQQVSDRNSAEKSIVTKVKSKKFVKVCLLTFYLRVQNPLQFDEVFEKKKSKFQFRVLWIFFRSISIQDIHVNTDIVIKDVLLTMCMKAMMIRIDLVFLLFVSEFLRGQESNPSQIDFHQRVPPTQTFRLAAPR